MLSTKYFPALVVTIPLANCHADVYLLNGISTSSYCAAPDSSIYFIMTLMPNVLAGLASAELALARPATRYCFDVTVYGAEVHVALSAALASNIVCSAYVCQPTPPPVILSE